MVIDDIIRKTGPVLALGLGGLTFLTGCSGNYDLPIKKGDIVKVDTPYLSFNVQNPDAPCGGGHCHQWIHLTEDSLCYVDDIEEFQQDTLTKEGNNVIETAYDVRLKCDNIAEDSERLDGIGRIAVTRAELDQKGNPVIYLATAEEAQLYQERK